MATVLGLAMKITADASGVQQKLTPVERAFKQLDAEAVKVTEVFKTFGTASEAAGKAQQQFATDLGFLFSALKTGKIDGEEFARQFQAISDEATAYADALTEGARITEQNRTEEEKRAAALARLDDLLAKGAIDERNYAIEKAKATGEAAESARQQEAAEKARADATKRAAEIIEASLSAEEKAQRAFSRATDELDNLRAQGLLTEEQYGAALKRSADAYAKATVAAANFGKESKKAGEGNTLKFNELSGILSALPGPLGSIAGRMSGLSSAGEGLSRVFSGGMTNGFAALKTQLTGLASPLNLAIAGVAAFGVAATAIAKGVIDLEDRVEKLGNTAAKLGVSFEFIQTLEEAARRSGSSVETLSTAFGKLQKNVTGIDEESKAAQSALASLGVAADDLRNMKPEEQYKLIGDRLREIQDPAERTATAMNLFGKTGAELLPFFNNLGKATADMERYGRALTDLDKQNIDAFGDSMDKLAVASQGLGQSLLLPFVGLGDGIATAFAEVISGITAIVDPIGRVLEPVLTTIGSVIEVIGIGLGTIGKNIGAVFKPFADLVQAVWQAFRPLQEGIVSFVRYLGDASTATTEWAMSFSPIGVISDTIAALSETISRVVTIITTAFSKIGGVISDTVGTVVEWVSSATSSFLEFSGLGPVLTGIGNAISAVFGSISSVFSTIANAIGGTVGRLLTIAENFLGIERAAEGAATGIDTASESVKEMTKEEQQAFDELQKAIAKGGEALNGAIEKAGEFGQAGFDAAYEFQQALADLADQAAEGDLNAEQYARGVALATAEYDKQIDQLKQLQEEEKKAADEAKRRAEADAKVVDQLLEQQRIDREYGGDTARAKAAEQALVIEKEIAKVREQVAAAKDSGDASAVAAGEQRLAQLGTIRDEQNAIADGSAKAAEDEKKRLDDQQKRVDELLAASQGQTEIEKQVLDVQEQQRLAQADLVKARIEGNQAEADAAAARLAQLDQLESKLMDQQQAVQQGFGDSFEEAFGQVDRAIGDSIDKASEFGQAGFDAAQRLTDGIAAAQEQARQGILNKEAFDQEVKRQQDLFDKEVERLDELKKQREKDAEDLIKQQEKAAEDAVKEQEKYQQQELKAQEQFFQEREKERAKYAEEQAKAAAAEAKRQEERIQKLNTLGEQKISVQDVRTKEGAATVLQLATTAQDPALIEARLQSKYLKKIADATLSTSERLSGQTVAIVGATYFG